MSAAHRLESVPSRLRQAVAALVATFALLIILCGSFYLLHARQEAVEDATNRAVASTRLIEEHIKRTFRTTDFIIGRVAELGRSAPMERLEQDRQAWNALIALSAGLPEPGTLWLVDSEGRVRLGTLKFPADNNLVTDRHYFSAHKSGGTEELVVGPMVKVKSRDVEAFHLSRRIQSADGRFLGVAAAGLETESFTDFYRTLSLGPNAAISIIDLNGRIILRQPDAGRWVGHSHGGQSPVMNEVARGHAKGTVHAISPLDGVKRLAAWQVVPEFGVVAVTAIAEQDYLSEWYEQVVAVPLAGLVAAVLLGWLALFAFQGLTREEALILGLERKVRERTMEAEARAEEARNANESKTRFLAAASHDLRQPLQAAGMFVEVLGARIDDPALVKILDKLRQSVDATHALLNTLLDVSTLEAGKIQANPEAFMVAPLLAGLITQLEPDAEARGLKLRLCGTKAQIISDPILLERILRNLLVNALRYTEKGGILLGCRRRGEYLAICVVDQGVGIPADQQDTIFDDFTRLGDKGAGTQRGLGLGLSVVRRTADLLGHPIEVKSIPGKGSSFAVLVPLA